MEEPLAPVTRADFERFAAEIRGEIAAAVAASAPAGEHDVLSDILGQLRVLKWAMGFALVAIMGAFGVLYQGQADLAAELRAEFRAEIAELRAQISGLRSETGTQIAGLRQEMRAEVAGLREEMQREFKAVRRDIAALGERVARLEAGQTFILGRLEDISGRLGRIEPTRGEDGPAQRPATS